MESTRGNWALRRKRRCKYELECSLADIADGGGWGSGIGEEVPSVLPSSQAGSGPPPVLRSNADSGDSPSPGWPLIPLHEYAQKKKKSGIESVLFLKGEDYLK